MTSCLPLCRAACHHHAKTRFDPAGHRSDHSATSSAHTAAAALKVQLSQHLLAKMRRLLLDREPGANAAYERALAAEKDACAQLSEAGAAVAHVEALLQLADLMEADPSPKPQDERPRLLAVLDVLQVWLSNIRPLSSLPCTSRAEPPCFLLA